MLPAIGAAAARRGARTFSRHNQKTRRGALSLQLLANDLFRCGVHGKAQHLFADACYFDPEAGSIHRPRACAQQLRGGGVSRIGQRGNDRLPHGFDAWHGGDFGDSGMSLVQAALNPAGGASAAADSIEAVANGATDSCCEHWRSGSERRSMLRRARWCAIRLRPPRRLARSGLALATGPQRRACGSEGGGRGD